jgi:hypothetical protein
MMLCRDVAGAKVHFVFYGCNLIEGDRPRPT